MARKTTGGAIRPFSASTSQSNKKGSGSTSKPTGAEAAEARRSKNNVDTSSAYTYIPALPKRHRTSAQTLSLSKDEAGPSSPPRRAGQAPEANGKGKGKGRGRGDEDDEDDDEEEDMESRIRKIAMRIAEDDLGELEDDDESEVDSDEAWEDGGSDDDRWGDIFRDLDKGKSKKGKSKAKEVVRKPAKPLTVNLDESEDEAPTSSKAPKGNQSVSEDEEDDEEDSEDEDDDEEEFAGFGDEDDQMSQGESDDEEDDDDDAAEISDPELPSDLSDEESNGDLDELDAFVDQIASEDKKRKTQLGGEEEADTSSKKKRRVLPVVPGPAVSDGSGLGLRSDQKVDIASLIASHPSLASASALLPSATKGKTPTSVLKQGTLSAPLPTIVQDRLNREAAYEKTKEEGAKWATLMKRVKEAEHLSFPLQGAERGGVKSSGEMLADYKPSGEHESAVHALLARANLTEKGVKQVEDDALQGQDLSMEEIKARRDQLRVQRELMFREEAKSKRVSKIKSKTFRKLARRRAAKEGEEDLEAMDEEDAAEVREKMERQRAKERATLRHGAKTGRWAREADGGGFDNDDKRRAKEEMLEMKEKLRRRIEGKGDEDDSDGSDEDSGDEEVDESTIKARAFDQLDKLGQNTEQDGANGKGLMQMAFMQKARERERQKVNEMEETTRRDIELFGDEEASDEEDEDEGKANMMTVNGNEGRMVFSGPVPGQSVKGKPTPAPTSAQVVDTSKQPTSSTAKAASAPTESSNPWLVASTSSGPSRKRNTVLNASSSNVDKATANLKKASTASKRAQNIDDDEVDIEVDGNVLLRKQSKKRSKADATDGDNSEDERDELMPNAGAFKQRDLVAEAFAGDNVVEDFAKEKQRIIDEDAPKTEDTSLTGWGAWGGKGVKKRKTNPKFLKTTAGIEASERKDAGKNNVIITEKKDKKARQFQVKDLPYPYTSIAQYEARFNNPLGAEWNSRSIHQKETMPRVTKKRGAIIEPVRRLF